MPTSPRSKVLPARSAGWKVITWLLKEMIHVETGLLLLRVMLGVLRIGHGLQKAVGWFHGPGLRTAAALFENWGGFELPLVCATLGAVIARLPAN